MNRKDGFEMNGINEDIFFYLMDIFPVFYSVLSRSECFPVEELNTFRLINSDFKVTQQLMRDFQELE